jgi:hypothetical protein
VELADWTNRRFSGSCADKHRFIRRPSPAILPPFGYFTLCRALSQPAAYVFMKVNGAWQRGEVDTADRTLRSADIRQFRNKTTT